MSEGDNNQPEKDPRKVLSGAEDFPAIGKPAIVPGPIVDKGDIPTAVKIVDGATVVTSHIKTSR